MLLTEVFQGFIESDSNTPTTNPVLNIPLKFISITQQTKDTMTRRHRGKAGVLASLLVKGQVKTVPPIQVKKTARGFELVNGYVRFHAYEKAGRYSIPCEVVPNTVTEDTTKFILYINGKPNTYYQSKEEADKQAEFVRKRSPNVRVEVKPGVIK
jgi:hypothetical protein